MSRSKLPLAGLTLALLLLQLQRGHSQLPLPAAPFILPPGPATTTPPPTAAAVAVATTDAAAAAVLLVPTVAIPGEMDWRYQCTGVPCACDSDPCQNNGTCLDVVLDRFECACPAAYDGISCEGEKDECSSEPCYNYGECTDGFDGYNCSCTEAFSGEQCQTPLTNCMAQSPNEQAQRILMNIFMTISVLVLLVALVVLCVVFNFLVFRKERMPLERQLHQAQEAVLFVSLIIVLLGRARTLFDSGSFCGTDATGDPPKFSAAGCSTIAMLLHYTYTVYFLLLFSESLHNYMTYTYVYVAKPMLTIWRHFILAFFLPIFPVAITAGFLFTSYRSLNSCWLNFDSVNFMIAVVPNLMLMAATAVVAEATGMLRNLPDTDEYPNLLINDQTAESRRTSANLNATGSLFIAPISMVAWVMGMTAAYSVSLSAYLFTTIANGLLVAALLIFHSMGNSRARELMERFFCGCCPYYKRKQKRKARDMQQLQKQADMSKEDYERHQKHTNYNSRINDKNNATNAGGKRTILGLRVGNGPAAKNANQGNRQAPTRGPQAQRPPPREAQRQPPREAQKPPPTKAQPRPSAPAPAGQKQQPPAGQKQPPPAKRKPKAAAEPAPSSPHPGDQSQSPPAKRKPKAAAEPAPPAPAPPPAQQKSQPAGAPRRQPTVVTKGEANWSPSDGPVTVKSRTSTINVESDYK